MKNVYNFCSRPENLQSIFPSMPLAVRVLMLLALLASNVFAAHPLVTDDAGTQGAGKHQIEMNTDLQQQEGTHVRVASFIYTYGLYDNLDLTLNLPSTVSAEFGIGDISTGSKWRFFETDRASLALTPAIFFPSGDENRGLGNGRISSALGLVGSYELKKWVLHSNLAINWNRYKLAAVRNDTHGVIWRVSAAAWYEMTEDLKLVGDIGIARNPQKSSKTTPAFLILGCIYSPANTVDLDAGVMLGLNKAEIDRQIGIGVTWRY